MLKPIVLYTVVIAAPLFLLALAWEWLIRNGQMLNPKRRVPFRCGLTAVTVAYGAQFLVLFYLRHAHPGFWPVVDLILGLGLLMQVTSMGGFVTSWLGRGYGRVASCLASLLIFGTWWLILLEAL